MKTFTDYLYDAFKFMMFGWFVAWLISCDDDTKTIRLIQQYQDSIGIVNIKMGLIGIKADSIREAFVYKWPARAYELTPTGTRAREAYRAQESEAYKQMLRDIEALHANDFNYLEDKGRYKRIVDSLKLILE